jgi:hypothetical protein
MDALVNDGRGKGARAYSVAARHGALLRRTIHAVERVVPATSA